MTDTLARATSSTTLALVLTAASSLLATGALVCLALSWGAPLPDAWGFRGAAIIHAIGFSAVGATIALRRRSNASVWLRETAR